MAPADSNIDVNKWKERVVSVKAVNISIHVFLLVGERLQNSKKYPKSLCPFGVRACSEALRICKWIKM